MNVDATETPQPADEVLMRQFRESFDEGAFDQLMRRYRTPALSAAWNFLGRNGATAQDAVQEAFVRVVRARGRFDATRSFAAWFYSILRNVCTDILRKDARRMSLLAGYRREHGDGAQAPPHRGSAEELLRPLAPADREILIYRVVHGMTFPEIAAQLDCTVESAKKRAQRALRRLHQHVAETRGSETAKACPLPVSPAPEERQCPISSKESPISK